MANFEVSPIYEDQIRKFEPSDPAHSDLFNGVNGTLLNNDAYLKQEVEKRLTADSLPDNLITTNEIINDTNVTLPGFVADARQFNRDVEGSFAATVMEAIEQQNNNSQKMPTYLDINVVNSISGIGVNGFLTVQRFNFDGYKNLCVNADYKSSMVGVGLSTSNRPTRSTAGGTLTKMWGIANGISKFDIRDIKGSFYIFCGTDCWTDQRNMTAKIDQIWLE